MLLSMFTKTIKLILILILCTGLKPVTTHPTPKSMDRDLVFSCTLNDTAHPIYAVDRHDNSKVYASDTADSTYTSSGKFGGGHDFNGSSNEVDWGDADEYSVSAGGWSISFWIYSDKTDATQALIAKYGTYSPYRRDWAIFWNKSGASGYYQLLIKDSGNDQITRTSQDSLAFMPQGAWTHLVFTWDGTTGDGTGIKIYENTIEIGTTSPDSGTFNAPNNSTSSLFFGRRLDGDFTGGIIDQVDIWQREISEDEIKHIYYSRK